MFKSCKVFVSVFLAATLLVGAVTATAVVYRKQLVQCVAKTTQWETNLVKRLLHPTKSPAEPSTTSATQTTNE